MPPPTLVTLPVRGIARATSRAILLTLAADNRTYPFVPGQAVRLGVHGGAVRKPYSIASAPADVRERGELQFLIATDGDDPVAQLSDVAIGNPIDVEGPFGSFVLPDPLPTTHLLLVAGGTGIAPLRAMWRHLVARETRVSITLAYSARTRADVAFPDEIDDLGTKRRMEAVITLSREQPAGPGRRAGRFDRDVVRALVGGRDALAFVCGPPGFVANLTAMLHASGLRADRVFRSP